ncbi:RluA family pseudouridine synthase [Tumebacillus permanentifrigoris]|uniref:Pseudouridine synthase n=1 Tax=Tumebacillus permanentifrigoris TaxID=378543 RepID=A0A316D8G6_9BACL|nr:RluA family pseudouridine synthase [Tumebacillus permanentifrigoris]PWK12867.1 RluA family pseudouridine synthase [Tumebacillus permanentifrigoris]
MSQSQQADLQLETEEQELEPTFTWTVEEEHAGERADKLITERVSEVSRSQVQELIEQEQVLVNDKKIKANYKVKTGDVVALTLPAPVEVKLEPEDIPLDVRYEDADVIVVNKARGMVVHPAVGHYSGTLVNALMFHCKDLSGINGEVRPGIVHRIDKDTSGLLMAAKNDNAHRNLSHQLKEHTVTRKYLAIVHGVIAHDLGTVDAPIGRHTVHRQQMAVLRENGREAVTHFQVLERLPKHTVVELKLETGRTHQIRVHMDFIGHPLVGDPKYGNQKRNRYGHLIEGQALHAQVLGFEHPRTGEYLEFSTDIPEEMQKLIDFLRQDA